ncbi:hypothetical protein HPP92_017588 [Vanilla planifolia]|uniref:Uncharacterized protein n=1 Tax=Vanilla planifolia TaxID=51239 RepID=A0A835Q888_VANPL|nr:hypothetical protein HPP92_017588 [Vanilla planifolia]
MGALTTTYSNQNYPEPSRNCLEKSKDLTMVHVNHPRWFRFTKAFSSVQF